MAERRKSNGQFAGMSPDEECIQRTFVQHFKMHGGDCEGFSIPNEGAGGGRTAAKRTERLKKLGLRPGAADYCVFWLAENGCRLFFIEFKAAKGAIRANQHEFAACAIAAGASHAFCRSWEEAWEALQAAGAPLARYLAEGPMTRFVLPPEVSEVGAKVLEVRGQVG